MQYMYILHIEGVCIVRLRWATGQWGCLQLSIPPRAAAGNARTASGSANIGIGIDGGNTIVLAGKGVGRGTGTHPLMFRAMQKAVEAIKHAAVDVQVPHACC